MIQRAKAKDTVSRVLIVMLVCVLFAGLFMQIGQMAEIAGQSKKNNELVYQLNEMEAVIDNLQVALNGYHNLNSIQMRAHEIGMVVPDSMQIRVLNLPAQMGTDTSAQTAALFSGDEMAK